MVNNTPRIARIDLKTFETAEIIEVPIVPGKSSSSSFYTETRRYRWLVEPGFSVLCLKAYNAIKVNKGKF